MLRLIPRKKLLILVLTVSSTCVYADKLDPSPELSIAKDTEIDPKFGLENELRDPLAAFWVWIANPISSAIMDTVLNGLGISDHSLALNLRHMSFNMWSDGVIYLWASPASFLTFFLLPARKLQFKMKLYDPNISIHGLFIQNEESGFYLKYSLDPNVIEVKSKPSTADEYANESVLLNNVMFSPMRNLGLRPARIFASGHMHMDNESAFNKDAQLLRDFVVDLINHPGLIKGPLSRDPTDATNPRKYYGRIWDVIDSFDQSADKNSDQAFDALFKNLQEAGLKRCRIWGPAVTLTDKNTIEFRFLPPQQSGAEIVSIMRLFKARLNWLKSHPGQVLRKAPFFQNPVHSYREMHSYATESGLEWAPYRRMLPWFWRIPVELLISACELKALGI